MFDGWLGAMYRPHVCVYWWKKSSVTRVVCIDATCILCSLTAPLAECKFPSFFSLLKHAFDTLHDRKGEISKVGAWLE